MQIGNPGGQTAGLEEGLLHCEAHHRQQGSQHARSGRQVHQLGAGTRTRGQVPLQTQERRRQGQRGSQIAAQGQGVRLQGEQQKGDRGVTASLHQFQVAGDLRLGMPRN